MDTNINNDIDELSYNTLETKRIEDILNDIDFKNDVEKNLCKEIVVGIEKSAYSHFIHGECTQIPFFGCIRRKYVVKKMHDIKDRLRVIRSYIPLNEFKLYIKEIAGEFKQEEKANDARKLYFKKIKTANKKKYKKLIEKLGIGYANMYIFAIYCFKEVPYDEEFEERYRELRDEEESKS